MEMEEIDRGFKSDLGSGLGSSTRTKKKNKKGQNEFPGSLEPGRTVAFAAKRCRTALSPPPAAAVEEEAAVFNLVHRTERLQDISILQYICEGTVFDGTRGVPRLIFTKNFSIKAFEGL